MPDRIDELKQILGESPQPRVYLQLTDLLKQEGREQEAVDTLITCVNMFPRYLSAKIALAKLYFAKGSYQDTIALCKEILETDRENLVGLRIIADAYFAIEDHIESIKHFKRLSAINPGILEVEEMIDTLEEILKPKLSPGERKISALRDYLSKFQTGSHHGL